MEFIPLEPVIKKIKKQNKSDKQDQALLSPKKLVNKRLTDKKDDNYVKSKGSFRKSALKNVKNQYKEKLMEKRAVKSQLKKKRKHLEVNRKKKNDEKLNEGIVNNDDDDDNNDDVFDSDNQNENEIEKENADSDDNVDDDGDNDSDNDIEEDDETEEKNKEQAKLEKWKQMDEKKKNRLFVKLKKKIYSESQIKELHPEIKKVIFPRKKKSRWCWAVFVSQESAHKAFLDLAKNKEIFVGKPNTREQVEVKRVKKMAIKERKKQIAEKHLKMWT